MNYFRQAAARGTKNPFFYRDADTIELRSGGGCLSIFGMPFLIAGLFVMQIPLRIIPVAYDQGSPWMPLFLLIFGGIFTAVGTGLVFGRSGIIIDRTRGRIVRWWGLLVPMKRTETMLDGIRHVEMNFSEGDSDTAESWPVRLSGEGIPKPIDVANSLGFAEARQTAEELSRFLHKPLVDSSTGERITRDPDHLDESYRDRVRRTGEAVAVLPPEPPGMRSRVERTGEGYVFHIPGPPLSGLHYIPVLFPLVIAGAVAWFFLPALLSLPMPAWIRYLFLGFIGLFFIAGPVVSALLSVLRLKNQFERITVTRAFLRVDVLKQGKRSTVEIPVDELEDLIAPTVRSVMDTIEVPGMKKVSLGDMGTPRMPDGRPVPRFLLSLMKMKGARGIIARSDKAAVEFAGGLDEAEVAYLFALIRKTIVG
ncbi:MAG TPA: hypothetical protein VFG28_03440 [Syntrophales bacterium]|nr:hypothetical protein [Syntrophales bacterium]